MFDLILSLYIQNSRIPEPYEVLYILKVVFTIKVLMCNDRTVMEDIEIILHRWAQSRKYGYTNRLFCIANVQTLSYTLQSRVPFSFCILLIGHR